MSKRIPFSGQLRQALLDSDVTLYRIGKETGVDKSVLSKFTHGKRGVSLDSIDTLCEYLGLELTPVATPSQRKGR